MATACKYGSHRVVEPAGVLPQPATKLNNDFSVVYDNEILVDVIALNIDSASFTQIEEEAGHDVGRIQARILEIVGQRGKMQNPVTGSGGMFIGKVAQVGSALQDRGLKPGDRIASLGLVVARRPCASTASWPSTPTSTASTSRGRPSCSSPESMPAFPRTWTRNWPWPPWTSPAHRHRRPAWSSPATRC